MKGPLAEGVLPGVLRELYVGRKTGNLHCVNGSERRSVRLERGTIVNADTNVTEDRLGEILVRIYHESQQKRIYIVKRLEGRSAREE